MLIMKSLCSLISKLRFNVFFFPSAFMTNNFPLPDLIIDLCILSKDKKSVCSESIFLKVTSSELFMNILAGSFLVVKLLAGPRNIT